MSDRAIEDDIMAELKQFGHSINHLMRLHAQASTWWGKQKVRRHISLTLRQQRRAEEVERAHCLNWTGHMVGQYRTHVQATHDRAYHPSATDAQTLKDQAALDRHAEDLRRRIIINPRLTKIEKGIALDGIDSATAFPHLDTHTTKLMARAHKLRGIPALHYRAYVARETTRISRLDGREQARVPAAPDLNQQPRIVLPAPSDIAERGSRSEAVQGLRVAQLAWNRQAPAAGQSERNVLVEQWRNAARQAEAAGLTEEQIQHEFANAEHNAQYTTRISATRRGAADIHTQQAFHATEAEATAWAAEKVWETNWAPGVQVKTAIHQRGNATPVRLADGGLEHVAAATNSWSHSLEQASPRPVEQPLPNAARLEGGHNGAGADRSGWWETPAAPRSTAARNGNQHGNDLADLDRLVKERTDHKEQAEKITLLQSGLDEVTADRDRLRSELDGFSARVEHLKNRNLHMAAELAVLKRNQPDVDELISDRERYKRERDQAVQKLAAATPAKDRFGSAQRIHAEQASETTQPWPAPTREGGQRGRIERSR